MTRTTTSRTRVLAPIFALTAAIAMTGCPPIEPTPVSDYDLGFEDGFAEDDWYWQGYWDSYDTVDGGPIYYQGSDIPLVTSPEYDAGYWDGVWVAYNDGYFVNYQYAFVIGFSEGYDAAFFAGYLDFLAADQHVEWLDGGWTDGYNDGFSEGRVFGANDYESFLPFDWLDALLDYESGTDLYFEEVDVGTGEFGPVFLYEYGMDPLALKATKRVINRRAKTPAIRRTQGEVALKALDDELLRPLLPEVRTQLSVTPTTTARSPRNLRLTTSWLQRVESYTQSAGVSIKGLRLRGAVPKD